MIRILFIGLTVLSAGAALGQNTLNTGIEGQVTDEAGASVPGVIVHVCDVKGISDIEGSYRLMVPPGDCELVATSIGFDTLRATVRIPDDGILRYDLMMSSATFSLGAHVVSAGKFEQKLEDVTVSMEVIKPDLIENRVSTNMDQAMDMVPGVNIIDGQANIRGGGGFAYGAGSRVLVMVDGMPMISADAGDVRWDFFGIENVEQIEVIKGASSALFGSSALNGVINIRTKTPGTEPSTRINVFHGMYSDPVRTDSLGARRDSSGNLMKPLRWWGDQNPVYTGVNFSHARKVGEHFDLVAGGQVFSDQGYRQGESEQRVRFNTNLKYRVKGIEGLSIGLNANAAWRTGGNFFLWDNADSGALQPQGGMDTATTTITFFNTLFYNLDPNLTYHNGKNKHELRGRIFHTRNRNTGDQSTSGTLYYGEYQYQRRFSEDHTLTGGLVLSLNEVSSQLYGDHTGQNIAGFAQYDGTFFERLKVSLGLRGEYFRIDTSKNETEIVLGNDTLRTRVQPVLRAGLNFRAFAATWIRASYGQGYRFPSVAERYINTNVGPLQLFPNPELQPEKGWSAEVGIKQGFAIGDWKGYADVAGFYTRYTNMIEFLFGQFGPPSLPFFQRFGFQAFNVEDALVQGFELTVAGAGELGPLNLSILAGYTYLNPVSLNADSSYTATLSNPDSDMLKYRFPHLFKADVQVDGWKGLSAGFSVRYIGFMENVDAILEDDLFLEGARAYREENNSGSFITDVRIGYKVAEHSKVSLVSNNVFNVEYMARPGDIRPPRTIAAQYTMTF